MVKQKALTSIIALTVSGIAGVVLALTGFSYWGIATQSIVYVAAVNLCYLYFSPWRPTWNINFRPLKGMIGFSSKLLVTNIFTHINNNLFSIILGRYYSEREVGQFNQANKWNLMGHSLISGMVNSVALPVLRNRRISPQNGRATMLSCSVLFSWGRAGSSARVDIGKRRLTLNIAGIYICMCLIFINIGLNCDITTFRC